MAKTDSQPKVKAGQVWKDNDPRGKGELFLVLGLDDLLLSADVFRIGSRRRVSISLSRFRPVSNGYTYQGMVDHLGVR